MPKSSRRRDAPAKAATAKTAAAPAKQKQPQEVIPIHDLTSPKMRKATRRLKELEDEKEQLIRQLNALKTLKQEELDDGESDSSSQQSAIQNNNNNSEVSSLNSRAHPWEAENTARGATACADPDDISVMTEDMYHYDVRGRRVADDNYYEIEDTLTTAACYQNRTGSSEKKTTAERRESSPRVWIEWKRGRSYKPDANLAYDDVYHHHPTDLSLMVADDKSFFDDLSLSSGEDSVLVAAVRDMPIEIDLLTNGSDESVNSALHSECSVSVAARPSMSSRPVPSKNLKQSNRPQSPTPSNAAQLLYQRSNSADQSQSEDESVYSKSGRRRRRPRNLEGSPPPLTSDMSLVDEKDVEQPKAADTAKNPPFEISFSEKSLESMESLGSELGGASMAPPAKPKNRSSQAAAVENAPSKKKTKRSKQKEQPPANNILGDRDSETEENELSMGALGFTKSQDDSPKATTKKMTTANNKNNTKLPSAKGNKKVARKPKDTPPLAENLNSSVSTLGAATGIDTEACVAAPRRSSLPGTTTRKAKNGKKSTRKAGGDAGNGVNKGLAQQNYKRQNSNSTCNSSLTSVPGVLDTTKTFIVEGGLVK